MLCRLRNTIRTRGIVITTVHVTVNATKSVNMTEIETIGMRGGGDVQTCRHTARAGDDCRHRRHRMGVR
jgi:hypothetical protein